MYFARVAWEMAACDLHFVGVSPLFVNSATTAIPESLDGLRRRDRPGDVREPQGFRPQRVLPARPLRERASQTVTDATNAYLDATPWGMLASSPPVERKVSLSHRTVDLSGATFDGLFEALGQGAATPEVLAGRDQRLADVSADQLRAAVHRLLVAETVVPMQRAASNVALRTDGRFVLPSVYNQMMLRRTSTDVPLVLTSSVAGTAFPISALDALALRALTETPAANLEKWVGDFANRSVMRLRIGERIIEDPAEQVSTILAAVDELLRKGWASSSSSACLHRANAARSLGRSTLRTCRGRPARLDGRRTRLAP